MSKIMILMIVVIVGIAAAAGEENAEPETKINGLGRTKRHHHHGYNSFYNRRRYKVTALANTKSKAPKVGFRTGFTIDTIASTVASIVQTVFLQTDTKNAFFTEVATRVYNDLDQRCNIIMWNMGIWHTNGLTGVLYTTEVEYEGERWAFWIVQGGFFRNNNINPFLEPAVALAGKYQLDFLGRLVDFYFNDQCYAG